MFDDAIADLKRETRRRLAKAAGNFKVEVTARGNKKLSFKPKSKIRVYHSKRRFASTVYIPAVYLRGSREESSRILTLPDAKKFNLPTIYTLPELQALTRKHPNLKPSRDKQYILYWKAQKSYPVYQINRDRDPINLNELATKKLEDNFDGRT